MKLLRLEKKVIDTKVGIFFVRDREALLEGGQQYIIGEGLQGEIGWTKQIYDILEKLECMEKENQKTYDIYLYATKLARDRNRKHERDMQMIRELLEKAKKELEDKKELEIVERE